MDTVANMLTTILNAQRIRKERVALPYSHFHERLLAVLKDHDRVADFRIQESTPAKFIVTLKYDEHKQPALLGTRRISRPGGRQYVTSADLPYPTRGLGFYMVSTSQGVMDEKKARKQGLGGELMCEIW